MTNSAADGLTPLNELISLADRRAVVTGAAQGFRFPIARRIAEAGAEVVVADFNTSSTKDAAARLAAAGWSAYEYPLDVADEASVESLFDSVGPVDILVNNAGVFSNYLVTAMPADEFRRIMDVNVASVDAISPSAEGLSHHTISQHAIAGLTRTLAPAGIRVNAVCPGATMTEGAIALVTAGAPDGMTLLLNGTGSTIARPSVASVSPTTSGGQSCS